MMMKMVPAAALSHCWKCSNPLLIFSIDSLLHEPCDDYDWQAGRGGEDKGDKRTHVACHAQWYHHAKVENGALRTESQCQ